MKLLNHNLSLRDIIFRNFRNIMKIKVFTVLNIVFLIPAVAQTQNDLPPAILKLVPSGTELISKVYTYSPVIAGASFTASKNIAIGRTVEYKLEFRVFDNSSPTWKMQESAYRKQMEDKIAQKRKSLVSENTLGMYTADPVKETKNSWGSGLTQRLLYHPPQASQYVAYDCAYYGMIGGIVFELYVSGLPDSPEEGNSWAQKVAEVVSGLSLANIGN